MQTRFKQVTVESPLGWAVVIAATLTAGVVLYTAQAKAAVWEEPTCDPSVDPASCNISPPLNTSSVGQTKSGDITFQGNFQLEDGGVGVSNGSLTLPQDSIVDGMVDDSITAGRFTRDSTGTAAIDLNSWSLSDPDGVEVVGSLPVTAITDQWVDITGEERVSGYVYFDPEDANALTPSSLDAITIDTSDADSGRGIYIVNDSPLSAAIEIDSISSASSSIRIDHAATNGNGILINSTGAGSFGLIASGVRTGVHGVVARTGQSDGAGVLGESDVSSGVQGITRASGTAAVYGEGTVNGAGGVSGVGTSQYGVFGNTQVSAPTATPFFGVHGCSNSLNCGYLGGQIFGVVSEAPAHINGRVYTDAVIPTVDPSTNAFSGSAGEIRFTRTVDTSKPGRVEWNDNVSEIVSDGDELWVLNADASGQSNLTRLDSQTGQTNAVSDIINSAVFRGLTVNEDGAYTVQNDGAGAGDLYIWDKYQVGSSTSSPQLLGNSGVANVVELAHFRSTSQTGSNSDLRFLAGREEIGSTSLLSIINPSNGVSAVGVTALPAGDVVLDMVVDNQFNMYAIVDVTSQGQSATHQLWKIDDRGVFVTAWDLEDNGAHIVRDMAYDGEFLWLTGDSSTDNDGLWRLHTETDDMQFFNTQLYSRALVDPVTIEFDGQNLWVGSSDATVSRVSPFSSNGSTLEFINTEKHDVATQPYVMEFDGHNLWLMRQMNSLASTVDPLVQMTTGNTYGNPSKTVHGGINMFSRSNSVGSFVEPQPVCVYADWDTTAGEYVLNVEPNACPAE